MPKIRINALVLETFQRLFGVTAFLEVVDKAIPQAEWHEREDLRRLAEEENWDFGDYDVQSQVLDEKFGHWLPRLAAYSLIMLLDSIVETQLFAFAERLGRKKGSNFQVKDMKGRGLEPAALYVKRVAPELDVGKDPAWEDIRNLEKLRNIIVHRGGTRGKSEEQQKQTRELVQAYPGKLLLPVTADTIYGEIWVSLSLCRDFAAKIEDFFKRVFKAAGLPDRGMLIER